MPPRDEDAAPRGPNVSDPVPPPLVHPDAASSHDNAFDLLRLVAACAVVVAHAPLVLGGREPLLAPGLTLGRAAVLVFFSISGYLVAQSLDRTPTLPAFALKRIVRIYPGLLVALAFTALVLGPIATTWALPDYFAASQTWRTLGRGFGLLHRDWLPGVFETNPLPLQTNAPLWTIKFELGLYAMLAAVGGLARSRRRRVVALAAICLGSVAFRAHVVIGGVPAVEALRAWTGLQASERVATLTADLAAFTGPFALAAAFASAGFEVARHRWLVGAAALAVVASLWWRWAIPIAPLGLCVLVLWAAKAIPRRIARQTRGWDLSYGLYIYAFPIQQLLASHGADATYPAALALWTFAIVLPIAAASWRLVELPILRRKTR